MDDHIIYAREAMRRLDCSDLRTLKKWCFENSIPLLYLRGKKRPYLLRSHFETAFNACIATQVRCAYPDKWHEVLQSHADFSQRLAQAEAEFIQSPRKQVKGRIERQWLTKTLEDLQSKRWSNRSTSPRQNNSNASK